MNAVQSIQALHEHCAVYTAGPTAAKLLDLAGWVATEDLSGALLLEPCVGEGAILLEAVERLIDSFTQLGRPLRQADLADRLVSFEIHASTAATTRSAVEALLRTKGISASESSLLARTWVRGGDFLVAEVLRATHVVANPPYVRWSKVPASLASTYRDAIRPAATRGDLAVAFIDRMLDWAADSGRVIALVSDRWMFAQYGDAFMRDVSSRGWLLEVLEERPTDPFVRNVAAYSAIVGFRRGAGDAVGFRSRDGQRHLHARLAARHGTLLEAGCVVKVGPALGCGHTFILRPEDTADIEPELLRPFIGRKGLTELSATPSDQVVACPYDGEGRPIQVSDWPGYWRWALAHKAKLAGRSCVTKDGAWWRTIDAIGPQWSATPKLLIPELCQRPVAVLDESKSIPAHSLYAIWGSEWPVAVLQKVLNAGLMRVTAEAFAPRLGHGWFRFYRRFLIRTPLPTWTSLTGEQKAALTDGDPLAFSTCFAELFEFEPDQT